MFIAPRVADKKDWITTETGDWEIIIGLEVHAQVASNSKLFSGSATEYGSAPNTQVSLVDAGMPGMLPVVNEFCIEQAVKTGFGLNAKSIFSRVLTARTIFMSICRKAIKFHNLSILLSGKARLKSCRLMRMGMSASPSMSGLNASIWNKMRVNPYMIFRQMKLMLI